LIILKLVKNIHRLVKKWHFIMHCQPCLCEKSHSICRVCRTGAVTSVVTSGFLAAAVEYTKPNYHSSSLLQNLQPPPSGNCYSFNNCT